MSVRRISSRTTSSRPCVCASSLVRWVSASFWCACALSINRPNFNVSSPTGWSRSLTNVSLPRPRGRGPDRGRSSARSTTTARSASTFVPSAEGIETHLMPPWVRRYFQIAGEIRELLDLRGHDGRLHIEMLALRNGIGGLAVSTASRNGGPHHLPVADELGREPRRAAAFACRTAQNESVPAILDDRMSISLPIGTRHLRNRLEPEHAAPAEFSEARQRVFQPVDLAQRIQFVDDEPQPSGIPLFALVAVLLLVHRLKNGDAHPGRDGGAQCGDLARLVGNEEIPGRVAVHPVADGKLRCVLPRNEFD